LTIRTAKTAGCLERRHTRAKFVEFVAAGFPALIVAIDSLPRLLLRPRPMTVAEKCGAAAQPDTPFATGYFLSNGVAALGLFSHCGALKPSSLFAI
jgi:hypothetical protein